MNKKGFTLIELLAIILILGIIAAIIAPNISMQISNTESNKKENLIKRIENASKIYASKYYANELVKGEEVSFSINDLLDDGVLTLGSNECVINEGYTIKFSAGEIINKSEIENLCNN